MHSLMKCFTGIWTMILIASLSTTKADDSSSGIFDKTTAIETKFFQTYLLLYNDAFNDENVVNCTLPFNVTCSATRSLFQQWTAPTGVPLMNTPYEFEVVKKSGLSRDADHTPYQKAWVELTNDNILVFHNPDQSISGPYICQSKNNDLLVYQTTVWVHVLKKTVFDVSERLKVAFIASAVFMAFIIVGIGACYWYRRDKVSYRLAQSNDVQLEILSIHVTKESSANV